MNGGSSKAFYLFGMVGALWGVVGVSLLFGSALYRLYPSVLGLERIDFVGRGRMALGVALLLAGCFKGHQVFHCRFSPRIAARALYLRQNPSGVRVILAPLFCLGYFHATRRRKIFSYGLLVLVVGLVFLVHLLAQPWRGMIDASVMLALGWGLISIWLFTFRAFFGTHFEVSPETPD